MDIEICEKYLIDGSLLESIGDGYWVDWLHTNGASRHVTAGFIVYSTLVGIDTRSIHEAFGGIGAHSTVIKNILNPDVHTVAEISQLGVQHLRHNGFSALLMDSYRDKMPRADAYALDGPQSTVWQTRSGCATRNLYDQAFDSGPKFVVATDIAAPHMHLHRQRYESLLGDGSTADYPTYLLAMSEYLHGLYGYSMSICSWTRWSAVFALLPGKREPEIIRTPDAPRGIRIA